MVLIHYVRERDGATTAVGLPCAYDLLPAQELQEKQPQLPGDIQWHFIGHVQSKKSRQLVGVLLPALEDLVVSAA